MKKIKLSQGKYALVDDEDFAALNQYKWCVTQGQKKHTFYACRRLSKKEREEDPSLPTTFRMHRQILNAKKGQICDHRDTNTLNNQKDNLRFCTNAENLRNQGKPKRINATSQYKGVSLSRNKKTWTASINLDGKPTYLGGFKKEKDAAKAYDLAAKEHWGDFAYLNFKDNG